MRERESVRFAVGVSKRPRKGVCVCVLGMGEECTGWASGRTGLIHWCRQGGIQIGYDRNVKAGYH